MKYTFGQFLGEYDICIPIIQRDYAQGREDKKYIRKEFLGQIEDVLAERKDELTLDYIYGYIDERNRFCPLDGQQRLTTLWLVLWYLSLKSKGLNEYPSKPEEQGEEKNGFTYETRPSSEMFCEKLWEPGNFSENNIDNIVDYIENQPWFHASWKKDPTIRAMLTTIGGIDNSDGIENILKVPLQKDGTPYIYSGSGWKKYKERLLNCIYFYVLKIEDDKLKKEDADDLYIKMNARGKSLSDFENFKADLLDRCRKDEYRNLDISGKDNENELDIYLSEKLDYGWNDPFWGEFLDNISELEASKDERDINAAKNFKEKIGLDTNPLLFSFVNRFCFGRLCVMKEENGEFLLNPKFVQYIDDIYETDEEGESDGKSTTTKARKELKKHIKDAIAESEFEKDSESKSVTIVNTLRAYSYLTDEETLSYEDFGHYEKALSPNGLHDLIKVLNGFSQKTADNEKWIDFISKSLDEIVPESCSERRANGSAYIFLPRYIRKKIFDKKKYIGEGDFISHRDKGGNLIGTVGSMDLKGRAYFFGICKYMEVNSSSGEKDKEHFEDWLYSCRNVIENAGIDSQSAMINCLRQLDHFGKNAHDIINGLNISAIPGKTSKLESQIQEEIMKAQYICAGADPDERKKRKDNIRKMENYAFFCGAIRFLFLTGGTGDKSKDLVPDWDKLGGRFKTIQKAIPAAIKNKNKVSFDFVQEFAKQFKGLEDPDLMGLKIFHTTGWARRGDSWIDVLCDPKLINQVEKVLNPSAADHKEEPPYSGAYRKFVDSEEFRNIVEKTIAGKTEEDTKTNKAYLDLCITKRVEQGYVLAKKSGNFIVYRF